MGLDTVELVLQLEDEFSIQMSDQRASEIITVGELTDYIVQLVAERGLAIEAAEVYSRVREILIENYAVKPAAIERDARIVKDLGLD